MIKQAALTILLMLFTLPALAGTPVGKETANAYFKNCMAQPNEHLTSEDHEALCSCSAVEMTKVMTIEDIQAMYTNTDEGQKQRNRLLIDIYAPCMNYPVQDLINSECMNDSKIDMMQLKGSRPKLCQCIAKKTGTWFTVEGRQLMAGLLAANPALTDPTQPVLENSAFKHATYENLISCLTGDGAGTP